MSKTRRKYSDLGIRMKNYEFAQTTFLQERTPIIIRLDGCNFHSYTKDMEKPFDKDLAEAFWETGKYLARNIMGCQLVYHQSDEISLLITNYDKHTTQSWFKNNMSKLESVSASMATAKFNEIMRKKYPDKELAHFDSRARTYPVHEVINYFIWRQQDASTNSVSMVAQHHFSHNSLQNLSTEQMQEKLFQEANLNWNDLETWKKRGTCIRKVRYKKNGARRTKWEVDLDIPLFTQDRMYIQKHVYTGIIKRDIESFLENSKEN